MFFGSRKCEVTYEEVMIDTARGWGLWLGGGHGDLLMAILVVSKGVPIMGAELFHIVVPCLMLFSRNTVVRFFGVLRF